MARPITKCHLGKAAVGGPTAMLLFVAAIFALAHHFAASQRPEGWP